MHYRPWVFLVLFGLAGVSAAEEAKTPEGKSLEKGDPVVFPFVF